MSAMINSVCFMRETSGVEIIRRKRGLRPKSQPARLLDQHSGRHLEIVTQCKLHDSRCSLNAGEVEERRAWTTKLRIETVGHVRIARQELRVRNVEGFPADRELVFLTPGHTPTLRDAGIQLEEVHSTKDVSRACFTRGRAAKTTIRRRRIREQIREMTIATAVWRRLNRRDRR